MVRGMGRPPLAVGTHGKITVIRDDDGWRARTSFRDYDGVRREVSRWGRTRNDAEQKLAVALRDRSAPTHGELTGDSRVSVLLEMWLADLTGSDRSDNTKQLYAGVAERNIGPALGQLRLRELTVPVADRALSAIRREHGAGAASTARSVLSGMVGYAVRHGAMGSNVVRDTSAISRKAKKAIRALTFEECEELTTGIRGLERAKDLDLPDLVEWMLGTGMRIGEACAVRESVLREGTVEVNATVVRLKGEGLRIQKRPKTAAGWRVLSLPANLGELLERRRTEARLRGPEGVLFCSPRGHLRDPSNTLHDLRQAFDELGFGWVTSHVFRKTVATRLDEAGFTAREVADILGHEKPSMTQDVYMGRKVVSARMATILNRPGATT